MVNSADGGITNKTGDPLSLRVPVDDHVKPHRYRTSQVEDALDEAWADRLMAATIWTLEVHYRRDKDTHGPTRVDPAKGAASTDRSLSGALPRKH